MTALDTTTDLPVVRPAAPVDEQLTGPWIWRRFVVWLAGWDKRREDWWDRFVCRFETRAGYVGRHRRMAWMDESTGEYPLVEVNAT